MQYVEWLHNLGMADVERVGGKNASLGEMIANLSAAGVRVPGGFATTADAYREFLIVRGLKPRIDQIIGGLDVEDTSALSRAGEQIRRWIVEAPLQTALELDADLEDARAALRELDAELPAYSNSANSYER